MFFYWDIIHNRPEDTDVSFVSGPMSRRHVFQAEIDNIFNRLWESKTGDWHLTLNRAIGATSFASGALTNLLSYPLRAKAGGYFFAISATWIVSTITQIKPPSTQRLKN